MATMSRQAYADMFGPTTGDRVRLADTELFIQVEKDFTVYGDEVKFGGGKVIRDGMGQAQSMSIDVVDLVITNALIIDYWGIVKADIGIKAGRIVAVGKAGNPDVQAGVDMIVGPGTDVVAGEGHIVTAGGIDDEPTIDPGHFLEARVRVIPVAAALLDLEAIREGLAGRDAVKADAGHAVHLKRHDDAVPVDRRRLAQAVGHAQRNGVALAPAQRGPGQHAVDGGRHGRLTGEVHRRLVDHQVEFGAA